MPDSRVSVRLGTSAWRGAAGLAVAAVTAIGLCAAPAAAAPAPRGTGADHARPATGEAVGKPAVGKPAAGKPTAAAPRALGLADKRPGPEHRPAGPRTDIVGGGLAGVGEFPYFVSVQSSAGGTGDFSCGGSLLSTTKVLTAAQCVTGRTAASLQVTIGGTTLDGADVGVVRDISAVTVDPAFNPTTLANDVAVLTLATPVTRADAAAQWLRLAEGNELGLVDPGDTSTVVGHGALATGLPTSNGLRRVTVPLQSDATMADPARYGAAFDAPTMLGAGSLAFGQGFCQGDTGGPLVVTSTPQAIQVGAASWSLGCAEANLPGVYAELYQGNLAAFVNSQVSRPANDRFGSAAVLVGNSGSVPGSNENATVDPGENGVEATVWYSWTPAESGPAQITVNQHAFDSQLTVYTGSAVTALSTVASNEDANGSLQSQVNFTAAAGTTYRIQVDGFAFDYGAFRLDYAVGVPANDNFAAPVVLSGNATVPLAASSARATGEAGEPAPLLGSADASLWFSWTAPGSGTARVSTAGSNYDTTLAVFTGTSLPALTTVASGDDFNTTHQTLISFPVTVGTTYRIQVGGFNGARGNLSLLQVGLNPEANDLFAAARVLSGTSGSVNGANLRAVGEPGEPVFLTTPDTSVWYSWTAPVSGTFRFDTDGSNFDTVLAAATGSLITTLTLVAANDDDDLGIQSQIRFAATAGVTYRIQVDGFAADRGTILLRWTQL